jgi:hypothetical protein
VTVAHVRAPAAAAAPVLRIRLAATCAEAKPLHYLGTRHAWLPLPSTELPSSKLSFASEKSPTKRDGVLGVENTGVALGKSCNVTLREWLFYHSVRHGPGQRLGSTPRRYSKENLLSCS